MYRKFNRYEESRRDMQGPIEAIHVRASENIYIIFQQDGGNQAGGDFRITSSNEGLYRSPC